MQRCWCGMWTTFSENGFFVRKTPLLYEDLYEDFYRNKPMLTLTDHYTIYGFIWWRIILVLFGKWTFNYTGKIRQFSRSSPKITRAKKPWSFYKTPHFEQKKLRKILRKILCSHAKKIILTKQSIMQCFQKTEIFLEIQGPTFYFWTFINVQKKKLPSIFQEFFQGSWTPQFSSSGKL